MKSKQEHRETLNNGATTNELKGCPKRVSFGNLFNAEWEELVITKDKTGKIVGRLACCAGASV